MIGQAAAQSTAAPTASSPGAGKYTGPGSCSSASCHGGVQARYDTAVLQNEYSTWAVRDKHPRAFAALTNEVGKRMGRILGIQSETSSKCLACHALNVPDDQKARTFGTNEGVVCENCHGPASSWLGPHTTRGWTYQKSLDLGMYNTRDLISRSEKCLSCHLGAKDKYVDHEMIAAGHPDLFFELDSFSAVMPRHWKQPLDKDPWVGIRTLATGQAVQLRENMRRIARSANRFWPEYAELDCFSCHHSLTLSGDSWRQERGYHGRRPGNPPWNPSRFAVFQIVANEVDPEGAQQLETHVRRVNGLVSDITSDRNRISAAASATAEVADRVAHRLRDMQFDAAMSMRLLKRISAEGDRIAAQGERAAEQAAMALDSLVLAYSANTKLPNEQQTKSAVNNLFELLNNPSAYSPGPFARQMRQVNAALQ